MIKGQISALIKNLILLNYRDYVLKVFESFRFLQSYNYYCLHYIKIL